MKPTILLVDDHSSNLVTLEAVLGTSEYTLITAHSGREALELLDKIDIAVILLDVNMPEMDGYECARLIKGSARWQHIPIILVTAIYREDPEVQRAYDSGAVEFFSKPFNPEILRLKVSLYAELYQKNLRIAALERRVRELEAQPH